MTCKPYRLSKLKNIIFLTYIIILRIGIYGERFPAGFKNIKLWIEVGKVAEYEKGNVSQCHTLLLSDVYKILMTRQ